MGTPFLALFCHLKVDEEGLKIVCNGQNICFKFFSSLRIKELNILQDNEVNLIQKKKQHIKFISKEINYKIMEENLLQKEIQTGIEKIKNQISTKARPIQMNAQLLEYCKQEIKDLLNKNLIRKSQSPWNCAILYVQKPSEIERGDPRLVINYKPLNKVLKWIRYPIPNKRDLIGRLHNA